MRILEVISCKVPYKNGAFFHFLKKFLSCDFPSDFLQNSLKIWIIIPVFLKNYRWFCSMMLLNVRMADCTAYSFTTWERYIQIFIPPMVSSSPDFPPLYCVPPLLPLHDQRALNYFFSINRVCAAQPRNLIVRPPPPPHHPCYYNYRLVLFLPQGEKFVIKPFTIMKVSSDARIFKLLRSPRIDSKEPIPPGCVAWRADTTTLYLLGSNPPKIV